MEAELIRTFRFDAAHRLPKAPQDHKCKQLHGHSYRLDVHVVGQVDPDVGWVMDLGEIKSIVEPLVATLDHRCLNDIPELSNSTAENIAKYIWDCLKPLLPGLSAVAVWEAENSRCVYRGN